MPDGFFELRFHWCQQLLWLPPSSSVPPSDRPLARCSEYSLGISCGDPPLLPVAEPLILALLLVCFCGQLCNQLCALRAAVFSRSDPVALCNSCIRRISFVTCSNSVSCKGSSCVLQGDYNIVVESGRRTKNNGGKERDEYWFVLTIVTFAYDPPNTHVVAWVRPHTPTKFVMAPASA